MFYVCYEVAPEEVANHCVLEGRATQLHPNTPVLLEDAASDEEKKKKTKPAELHTDSFVFLICIWKTWCIISPM